MNYQLVLTIPEHLRIGQTLYNFLEWLAYTKPKYRFKERTGVLADIFSIKDNELIKYYNEWLEELEDGKK